MRSLALSVAALVLPLSLAACGSDDSHHDVATDPAAGSGPGSASPSPTAVPTVGTYPDFEPTDYTFELTVSCFCMTAGAPIEVTVANAEVVGAIYGMDSGGRQDVKAGDPVDTAFWLTINDVIAQANDTSAAKVRVDWPAGQDYPTSVFVDHNKQVADDEIGYTVSDVVIAPAQ